MAALAPVIETMEHCWMRAWVAGDTRTLKAMTSRNFRMIMGSTPSAMLDSKSWLEAAAKRFRCKSYRLGDIYVRDLGGLVIFATQLEMKATMDGHDWSGRFWVTDLWRKGRVRRKWQLVERVLSRPEDNQDVPSAIRSLQLWR
jgi:hypothetical protein